MIQKELETLLGFSIHRFELFQTAFTHRSAVNEHHGIKEHNERLEFLGDAVLELIVTEYLFKKFPELAEGVLTNLRASLVKGETLYEVAKEADFGKFLKISKGEEMFGGREKVRLLANTMESTIGAIYIDSGFENAAKFIHQFITPKLTKILETGDFIDAKSYFQQIAQAEFKATPIYKEISSSGPDHDKIFTIGVFVDKKQYGVGKGSSKQIGEQAAAKQALDILKIEWKKIS
jgi:ribonuclease III